MKQTIPKKLASGVVAAAMTLSLLPAAALAADSEYSASGATGFAFTDSGIAAENGSYTGYKISGTSLTIRGLTLNIESGTLNISAGDDAIHCDYVMNVGASGTTGPSITIKACYEGLEAATLNILSGNISILSEDDCLNAANSDLTGYSFSMTISGGAVVVWTANTADDQPLDADGTLTVSGGTVLAAGGSAGMGVPISAAQPYVTFGSTGAMGGGQMGGSRLPSLTAPTAATAALPLSRCRAAASPMLPRATGFIPPSATPMKTA